MRSIVAKITRLFFVIILLPTVFMNAQSEQERSIPVSFSISSTGINRFIAGQWASMNTSWSGTTQGVNWMISLNKPQVSLTDNAIKIVLTLNISASPVYSGSVNLNPTLNVPASTLSAANIITEYQNLQEKINELTILAPWLRDEIENLLAPVSWVIYQGNVLNQSTVRLSETADVKWKGLPSLSYQVTNGELNLTVTPTIESIPPQYAFQWKRPSNRDTYIKIISNNLFSIESMKCFSTTPSQEFPWQINPSFPITATFDSELGKYTAQVIFSAQDGLANYLGVVSRVRIKRQNAESIYSLHFNSQYPTQNYISSMTTIVTISGE
ncbi:MAG: hypothetical protein HRU80_16225 [Ignavibacteriales bacterium]|nr:MAG: hypothetical protein HRU80_16225 [Ignavibacteriales bacterium]